MVLNDRHYRILKRQVVSVRQEIENLLKDVTQIETVMQVEVLMETSLKPALESYNKAAMELFLEVDETKADDLAVETKVQKEQAEVRSSFSLLQVRISKLVSKFKGEEKRKSLINPASSTLVEQSSRSASEQPRLKKIDIPEFDGDLSNFYNFKALFTNLVHNNPDFSNVQKLFYLKQALVGNAAIVLKDCDLAEDAYGDAWSYFLRRYESKRAIVRNFFVKLSSLQQIRSENGIREMLDEVVAIIRGLKVAGEGINETFSRYISYLVSTKLDLATAKDWDNHTCSDSTYPNFDKLFKFLQGRTFVIDERFSHEKTKETARAVTGTKKSFSITSKAAPSCNLCSKPHFLNQCTEFKAMNAHRRFDFVKQNRLCLVCFSKDHTASSCTSKFKCRCGKPHHNLLHFDFKNSPSKENAQKGSRSDERQVEEEDKSKKEPERSNITTSCHMSSQKKVVLLPSAIVRFKSGKINGTMRILLDICSQPTVVSDRLVKKCRLPAFEAEERSVVRGVGGGLSSSQSVKMRLQSRVEEFAIDIEADVLPASAMSYEVYAEADEQTQEQLAQFQLADPAVAQKPVRIEDVDLILGAEYYHKCMCEESKEVNGLGLTRSRFGWTVTGPMVKGNATGSFSGFTLRKIEQDLRKYFEFESFGSREEQTKAEANRCVQHFEDTYQIGADGRFNLELPFKVNKNRVANNHRIALKALFRSEQTIDLKLKSSYIDFMREYIALGHASLVKEVAEPAYYIPHRAVVREESSTTPVRVVFNASSKAKGEVSLNEALMLGPQIQRELFDILISVRSYCYVFSADIEKMYRMVWIKECDRDMQRILWRELPLEPVCEYRLNTVTYGTTPASFLATQCLEVIAKKIENDHPQAAALIRRNFYMDDLIAGGDSLEEVRKNCKIIYNILLPYGFRLRKYCANAPEILADIPGNLVIDEAKLKLMDGVAILGIFWSPSADTFGVKLNLDAVNRTSKITKRLMMSTLARTFDPLGLIAPVGVRGKLMLQQLWKKGLDWDVIVPDEVAQAYDEYIEELRKLESFVLPRFIGFSGSRSQLVGFCDASNKAYCAVLYFRSIVGNDVVNCNLVCSKTRVAPTKAMTIPKLELAAGVLVSQLIDRVRKNLNIELENCYLFTDATIVLCWLSRSAEEWKTFVSNRVLKIQNIVPYNRWFYVNTRNNPADLATRGLSVNEFLASKEWLEGPGFLKSPTIQSDPIPNLDVSQALEKRKEVLSINKVIFSTQLIDHFSSFNRLRRVLAYVIRFIDRTRKKKINCNVNLSVAELDNAFTVAIRIVQLNYFFEDVNQLNNSLALKATSKIVSLAPFLDEQRVLRVGGRLENACVSEMKKHPVILHARAHLVRVMVRWLHEKYFHAGRKFLMGCLASKFWSVGGCTNLVKAIIRDCVKCTRFKGETVTQMMGQLPAFRVNVSRPFAHTGVDLAGPFKCKCVAHRTTRYYKIYMAIFVCMTVKCVHIEIVTDLTTAKFVEALQRFIARRGAPAKIYSDNGTNFVGTRNLIVLNLAEIESFATSEGIEWSMIPPRSPHFGGLWESAVRSAKHYLLRVTDGNVFSYDEYSTLFARIEAILNSRPLCLSVNQGEDVITPGHFLIGRSLSSPPELESENETKLLSRRLLELNRRAQSFWKVWRVDYLNQLQRRYKWQRVQPNLEVGSIVLLKDESPPCQWPLAVVVDTYPGKDGTVRVVKVRVANSSNEFKRAVVKLVKLPIDGYSEPLKGSAGGAC